MTHTTVLGLVTRCKFKFVVHYFSFILLLLSRMKTKDGDKCGTNLHPYDYCRAQQSLNIFEQIVYPPS